MTNNYFGTIVLSIDKHINAAELANVLEIHLSLVMNDLSKYC